jgi:arylsulfatase A-like enzyme
VCLAAALGCGGSERPSVLLVTIDTLRYDRLSIYSYRGQETPRLDAIGRDGAVFEQAVCDVPWTSASMASVFTGRYATYHGVQLGTDRLSDDAVTLAEVARAHAYRTAGFIGSFPLSSVYNLSQGFETYDEHLDTPMVPFPPGQRPAFPDVKAIPRVDLGDAETFGPYFAKKIFNDAIRTDDAVTDAAARWLRAHHEKPFLLWVHYFGPHERGYLQETPEQAAARIPTEYDRDLAFTDAQVGRLVRKLGTLGLRDRALLIVHADHGQSLGENGYVGHGENLYPPSLRIPLLVRWPGRIPAGVRMSGWVENVDIFPTVLHSLGIDDGPPVDGRDLLGYLLRASSGTHRLPARRPAYSETYLPTVFERRIDTPDGWLIGRLFHRGLLADGRMYVTTEVKPPCAKGDHTETSDEFCRSIRVERLFAPLADPQGLTDLAKRERDTLARLRRLLEPYRNIVGLHKEAANLDAKAREKLRALGYLW